MENFSAKKSYNTICLEGILFNSYFGKERNSININTLICNTIEDRTFRDTAIPEFGLFDYQTQLTLLEKAGDPLVELKLMIDWEQFRSLIERAREKPRISPAGAKE